MFINPVTLTFCQYACYDHHIGATSLAFYCCLTQNFMVLNHVRWHGLQLLFRNVGVEGPKTRTPPSDKSAIERRLMEMKDHSSVEIFEPVVGTNFDSCQEAYDFYNLYSWEHGFGIRCGKSRTNTNKYRSMCELMCQCGVPLSNCMTSVYVLFHLMYLLCWHFEYNDQWLRARIRSKMPRRARLIAKLWCGCCGLKTTDGMWAPSWRSIITGCLWGMKKRCNGTPTTP